MSYVRCIDNKAYIEFEDRPIDPLETTDLSIGRVYKVVPPTEDDRRLGELRVYDDTGEDFLFPASYFDPYLPNGDLETADSLSISLNVYLKNILRAEALAAQKSVSALLRELVEEKLDLPAG